jgi:hypothetical protein
MLVEYLYMARIVKFGLCPNKPSDRLLRDLF